MRFVERVEAQLPRPTALAYRACQSGSLRTVDALRAETDDYLARLGARAQEEEFLDLETAGVVAKGCHALLDHLRENHDDSHRRAVQAAVDYFVLEDDAEDDNSLVGMDDDLQVIVVTAQVLGWDLPGGKA